MEDQVAEVYPETPEVQDSWGCARVCDYPIWNPYGEITLDDQPTIKVFIHQCRDSREPVYSVDGHVQLRSKADLAEYVRGLYGSPRV